MTVALTGCVREVKGSHGEGEGGFETSPYGTTEQHCLSLW